MKLFQVKKQPTQVRLDDLLVHPEFGCGFLGETGPVPVAVQVEGVDVKADIIGHHHVDPHVFRAGIPKKAPHPPPAITLDDDNLVTGNGFFLVGVTRVFRDRWWRW